MDYENKHPILQKLEDYFKNTPKEQIDKDWSNILKETDPESYYERKYKKALEWMQSLYSGLHGATKEEAEHYFPELKENKSERVRKGLIKTISSLLDNTILYHTDITKEEALAWLEKQGEKKPFDYENVNIQQKDFAPKVEPKFKVGDKVIIKGNNTVYTIGIIAPDDTCWLTHEGHGCGWSTFGILKHYVE